MPKSWQNRVKTAENFFLGIFVLGLSVATFFFHLSDIRLERTDAPERWARTVLKGLPENAVVFTFHDMDGFLYAYLTQVEGFRKDVMILDAVDSLTPLDLQEVYWDLYSLSKRAQIQRKRVSKFFEQGRPVFGANFALLGSLPEDWKLVSDGFHYRLLKIPKDSLEEKLLDRHQEAEDFFEAVLKNLPAKDDGWFPFLKSWVASNIGIYHWNKAVSLVKEGEDKKEIQEKVKVLRKWSLYSPFMLVKLGELYTLAGPDNFSQAYQLFTDSINLSRVVWLPEMPEAWFGLGHIEMLTGDWVKSLYHTEQALRLDPKLANAYFQRGLLYKNNGNLEAAQQNFNRAGELEPKFAQLLSAPPPAPTPSKGPKNNKQARTSRQPHRH